MTCRGRVQGGVIVLPDSVILPEGTEVTIIPDGGERDSVTPGHEPTIWEKMVQLATWAETQPCNLPDDLAMNHDHYLHGLAKKA